MKTFLQMILVILIAFFASFFVKLMWENQTMKAEITNLQYEITSGHSCHDVCLELFEDWGC